MVDRFGGRSELQGKFSDEFTFTIMIYNYIQHKMFIYILFKKLNTSYLGSVSLLSANV